MPGPHLAQLEEDAAPLVGCARPLGQVRQVEALATDW